jgi:FMN phosphatase YigB (HAD superfamily)
MKNKIILTDCDGVLLDWEFHFSIWLERHGYHRVQKDVYCMATAFGLEKLEASRLIRMFNESATIRKLSPLRDAIKYVKKLHEEHGYIFHVITSLSNDEYSQHLRTKNLRELFGTTVFDKFVYLDCGADKHEALEQYKNSDCFWIEDKIANAELGLEYGLDSILMDHTFNKDYTGNAHYAKNWKDIYNLIIEGSI